MNYQLNFDAVWRDFPSLLAGLGLGLELALISIAIGCVIGLANAFALLSRYKALRIVASIYVTVVRNTPILVLILLIYFALPGLGIRLDKLASFIVTLSLYAGAYLTEVFRAGLLSIHKGQREAGLAIGLGEWQVRAYIIVPVMLRNVLPALSNNFISLFKDTSLAAAIAVPELTYYARKINVESYRVIETWLVTTALYAVACYVIALLLRTLEQRLAIRR
ncbi:amino acid ABC transporter permease [Pseudomonas syringae]|uniref:amino acid ABC transporter permease n=1 Tax=Pseudomonas syringae TaxID=317 RepID=UPI0006CB7FE8|nr:amino acid ABC transporter permease [Pseudomonas syringae]ALD96486.1 amino acid ABC transporter permease [Pseudomonas syringae UMAF0158]MCK9692113.1 amino acid ABC transporter permease [Pseudomonas syringae pv. syringae]MCK9733635.1 amino acid ABC transporter permease [Pseudomonas syringae pv. syringae]MCK9776598.1 amino acid ABC transporter permease [Pseudomonas syringae pv. syringae]NAO26888.1 amino acid ABC transporter permease [Pseudomonas syringae pv. dysoxyli]